MENPLVGTKLYIPRSRRALVPRPRLRERLRRGARTTLTLVSAPAGFGKTTLLAEWAVAVADDGPPVAWLSLDQRDDQPTTFWTYLITALNAAVPEVGASALALLGTAQPAVETVLATILNELAEVPCEVGLVLDDYHVVNDPEIHRGMSFLLGHLPAHVHVMIGTRADPPLPLSRLRARGELVEIRAADLRFTVEEAAAYFDGVAGLDLTATDVAALERRTEGWIAALQLAGLSMQGRDDVAGFVAEFTGDDRFIVDYLVEEVLERQPDDVREFLLHTAVLERLTGALCDAVTGRGDGSRMLESLERANLFVVALDDRREWYRYHHLFADVLHARLLAEHPEQVPDLHERAGVWFVTRGLVADAVRHALAAEDFDRAANLMEEALPALRRARQDGLLLMWVRSLPEPVVRRSPVLCIVSGWSLMMSGDLDAVGSRLDDAEAALTAGAQDPGLAATWADTEDLRTAPATVSIYRASLAQARGDVAGTVRHARRALDLAGPEDHFVRGAGGGFLGLAAWASGNVHEALATFSDAVRSLHAAGNFVDELDSTVVLADMWVAAGRPGRARRLYEQALQTATAGGAPYPRATADLHVGLAELDRERDDLASAQAHLETARVLGERACITENQHRWYVVMAQVRAAGGDHDAATRLLGQAQARYRLGFYPDVRPIAAVAARVQIAGGDLSSAAGWAQDRAVSVDDEPDYLREYEHLTLARLLLARHRAADQDGAARASPGAVLGLLDRLHAAAIEAGRDGSVAEIQVLQALVHHVRGDLAAALAALGRSLVDGPEPDGYKRLYLDEGAPMLALLRHAAGTPDPGGRQTARDGRADAVRAQARRLLERATTSVEAAAEPPQTPGAPLSRREQQVLRRLDSELTGPEIARELHVTLNTLRTHTKRIFTKLDVTTRAAAVRRAHERGLL